MNLLKGQVELLTERDPTERPVQPPRGSIGPRTPGLLLCMLYAVKVKVDLVRVCLSPPAVLTPSVRKHTKHAYPMSIEERKNLVVHEIGSREGSLLQIKLRKSATESFRLILSFSSFRSKRGPMSLKELLVEVRRYLQILGGSPL